LCGKSPRNRDAVAGVKKKEDILVDQKRGRGKNRKFGKGKKEEGAGNLREKAYLHPGERLREKRQRKDLKNIETPQQWLGPNNPVGVKRKSRGLWE